MPEKILKLVNLTFHPIINATITHNYIFIRTLELKRSYNNKNNESVPK
jgi:hypothetical protein